MPRILKIMPGGMIDLLPDYSCDGLAFYEPEGYLASFACIGKGSAPGDRSRVAA
jgi:hypothetical protein